MALRSPATTMSQSTALKPSEVAPKPTTLAPPEAHNRVGQQPPQLENCGPGPEGLAIKQAALRCARLGRRSAQAACAGQGHGGMVNKSIRSRPGSRGTSSCPRPARHRSRGEGCFQECFEVPVGGLRGCFILLIKEEFLHPSSSMEPNRSALASLWFPEAGMTKDHFGDSGRHFKQTMVEVLVQGHIDNVRAGPLLPRSGSWRTERHLLSPRRAPSSRGGGDGESPTCSSSNAVELGVADG